MPTIHLLVRGKVQGVYFRASAKEKAESLHITGWIKNTPEGDVEALASGSEEQLHYFTEWCRQGPPNAVVTGVVITEREEERFDGFKIVRGG
jgi:acylphosphatase